MYFVIVLNDVIEERHFEEDRDQMPHRSTVAWFSDLEKAKEAVEKNKICVYQPSFIEMNQYVVIEHVQEGVMPDSKIEAWFVYEPIEEIWREIEQPAHAYTKFNYFS